MNMTIGANIKRLRTAMGITQEQLAESMNVSCAAVSKWERGETYPDITLLQPLAYYFRVTLDELMGYDQEKVQAEINDVIALYREHWYDATGRDIIVKAYHDYPNDYLIMHSYMWNIGGDLADNDPAVLIEHKDEFLAICEKILEGCTEENIRLNAWNMRAKILHAEGKTEEALEIYKTKFADWFTTVGQKTEQLFAKDTDEYYFHVQKNMYELADFAADKLGRKVFFDPSLSMAERTECALKYGDILLNAFEDTGEDFFLVLAQAFLGRMEDDLSFRGGSNEEVTAVMDKRLYAVKMLTQRIKENTPLRHSLRYSYKSAEQGNLIGWLLNYHYEAKYGRRAELLNDPAYVKVLDKYK